MTRILIIESDIHLRQQIADYLENEGWDVDHCGGLAHTARSGAPAVAIVSENLSDGSMIDVMRHLRSYNPKVGIIILGAAASSERSIALLQEGADHILPKSIRLKELSAYLSVTFRRLGYGSWRLDLVEQKLYSPKGQHTRINRTEIALLEVLSKHSGNVVGRPQIVRAFGAEWVTYDERRLEQVVSRLRRRCEKEIGNKLPLRTEHGIGYSFSERIQIMAPRQHA
jgi:DNA-binding response OmpR family regulator